MQSLPSHPSKLKPTALAAGLAMVLLLLLAAGALAQDDYSQWTYSKNCTLNTTSSGTNVANHVYNFPVLVRLDAGNFTFSQLSDQTAGTDLRFSKSDGTHLYYQIERNDPGTPDSAEIWVLVDTVKGNNSTQFIKMYWGKASASDSSRPKLVFDTAQGWRGVWHLNSNTSLTDVTYRQLVDTNHSMTNVGGMVGSAVYMDGYGVGTKRYLGVPSTLLTGIDSLFTMSFWNYSTFNLGTDGSYPLLNSTSYPYHISMKFNRDSTVKFEYGGTSQEIFTTRVIPTATRTNQWNLYTYTRRSGKAFFYINGAKFDSISCTRNIDPSTATTLTIGDGTGSYSSSIDEMRFARANRDSNWVKLEYANQKATQTLVRFGTTLAQANEDYSQWANNKSFYLNTTSSGANVPGNVLNFPVLVRLSSSNFDFSQANTNGNDIRFAKSDGTHLYYQIERFDGGTPDSAEIWVKLDTVYGNNASQFFTMYWGKTAAIDSSRPNQVFDTANSYTGVWHLGNVAALSDATIRGNTATNSGTTNINGIIGKSASFVRASSQKIALPIGAITGIVGSVSVSLWVYGSSAMPLDHSTFNARNASGFRVLNASIPGGDGRIYWDFGNGATCCGYDRISKVASSTEYKGQWNNWVFTHNSTSTNMYIYLNGVRYHSGTFGNNAGAITAFDLGYSSDGYFDGYIDEFQIAKTERDSNWIKLCYENQRAAQTLLDYDNYADWTYSKAITVNTTPAGANVPFDVINYPLLVRLNAGNFNFGQLTNNDGRDLRFAKSDGSHLSYEIERCDGGTPDSAEVWVKMDTVKGNGLTQFYMYWNKAGVTTRSSGSKVFDTANGFTGVWHLNGIGDLRDVTYRQLLDTNHSTTTGVGNIGSGNDMAWHTWLGVPPAVMNGIDSNITVSFWNYGNTSDFPRTDSRNDIIMTKGTGGAQWYYGIGCRLMPDTTIRYNWGDANGANDILVYKPTSTTMWKGQWNLWTLRRNPGNWWFYINGTQMASGTTNRAQTGGALTQVNIGSDDNNGDYTYRGKLDEFRFSKNCRDSNWVKLDYETQKQNVSSILYDQLLPVTIRRTAAQCSVYTARWNLYFDVARGGSISFLSDSGVSTNQLNPGKGLFQVVCNADSSVKRGSWSLLDSSNYFARVRELDTLNGVYFTNDYTIYGSGKMFIRSEAYAPADMASTPLRFVVTHLKSGTLLARAAGATADVSSYVLLGDDGVNQYDVVLAPYDNWSTASNGMYRSSATGWDNSTAAAEGGYAGYLNGSFAMAAGQKQSWEFMVDFSHKNWNDTAGTGVSTAVADFRTPDSLSFIAGSYMNESSWEDPIGGHWKLDYDTGTSVRDASGQNNHGTKTGGAWVDGRWGQGINLTATDSIVVPHNTSLTSGAFTIMAWLKPSGGAITTASQIIHKFSSGLGYKLTGASNDTVLFTVNGTTLRGSRPVGTAGTWHHIAARHNKWNDEMSLYYDGGLDAALSTSTDVSFTTDQFVIGNGYTGVIDDVRYYGTSLSDEAIKAIYRKGYKGGQGLYNLRADDNNSVHFYMNGGTTPRYFPNFQIDNWWSGATPNYVFVNSFKLKENVDYKAKVNSFNQLFIGFNTVVSRNNTRFYIDDDYEYGTYMVNPMKKMYWGKATVGSEPHFWVKNFSGNTYGNTASNTWFIDWKLSQNSAGGANRKDGEPWYLGSSLFSPNATIDTTANNCFSSDRQAWGQYVTCQNTKWISSSNNVNNAFTYTVQESSTVRLVLRIGQRTAKVVNDSFNIDTRWTIYPTGQIFRWDSVTRKSNAISSVYFEFFMKNVSSYTSYVSASKLRGGIFSAELQDFGVALLSFSNSNGIQAYPWDNEIIWYQSDGVRTGISFYDWTTNPNTKWGAQPTQSVFYMDIQRDNMDQAYVDSASNGVQKINGLIMTEGTAILDSNSGDLNKDGFCEKEGAYIVQAANNSVRFKLPAHGDTCRYYPAFRITNYTAATKPKYVFVNSLVKLEDYGYNAYLKKTTNELILQFNDRYCDTTEFYISYDKTLAVTLSAFVAIPGDSKDTLRWRTESEQENLGFMLVRRIRPQFMDSIARIADTARAPDSTQSNGVLALRKRAIAMTDTGWRPILAHMIPGAPKGVSYGPRDYMHVDRYLQNDVEYEYRLLAYDYSGAVTEYGPVAVRPRVMLPLGYLLMGNMPNPFRRMTQIQFSLPEQTAIELTVYDLQGRIVNRLIRPDKRYNAGYYRVQWDGRDMLGRPVASGPYIYRLSASRYAKARLMVMVD